MLRFGEYEVDEKIIDLDYHNNVSNEMLNSNNVKFSGVKNFNRFCNVPKQTKLLLKNYMNNLTLQYYDWNFEYFHSGEPAGLHTDYDTVKSSNEDNKVNIVEVGVLIPLDWNCKQPYTVFYNKTCDVPRKLIYRKGEMRFKDNDEIVSYREGSEDTWWFDEQVLKYNPIDSFYIREYANLKVDSVYQWNKGSMVLFDTKRWHSSSWFLSSNVLPDISTEYKKSIIGFGSRYA